MKKQQRSLFSLSSLSTPALLISSLLLLSGCAGINRADREVLIQRQVAAPVYDKMVHGRALSTGDIIELSRRQVPPPTIIRYIESSGAIYSLDKVTLKQLNQAKVSKEVILYLANTPAKYGIHPRPGTLYYPTPWPYDAYPYYGPYYGPYAGPYYGPAGYVVFGGHRHHR